MEFVICNCKRRKSLLFLAKVQHDFANPLRFKLKSQRTGDNASTQFRARSAKKKSSLRATMVI